MERKKHIVVVEDERHLANGIQFNLEAENYAVTIFGDGPSALTFLMEHESEVDLLILDLMLPGMSGYAVCEQLRNAGSDLPILILSARNQTVDRIRGFDLGANQYLCKPFDLDELLSRVRNMLTQLPRQPRLSAVSNDPATELSNFSFADFQVDFLEGTIRQGEKQISLTRRELDLLRYFVLHAGRLIPRAELLEKVWSLPGHVQTRTPDQFLLRLRKIFEPDPASPRYFLTVRDLGYKFVPEPVDAEERLADETPEA